jgi:hypothetical protein
MDPLSIAGSVAGLVTLADTVFRGLSRYRKGAMGAPKEIKDLMGEVKNISVLLHNLALFSWDLEESSNADGHRDANVQMRYLHDCHHILGRLQKELPEATHDLMSNSGFKRLQVHLAWPFSAPEIREMIEALRNNQKLINVALAAESITHLKEVLSRQKETHDNLRDLRATADEILDIQTKIMLDTKRTATLDFFLRANPQSEFEMNKKLRHPLTGLWLTEGEDFREWYEKPNAKLWLTGIPGSGKSVIAGALITECMRRIVLSQGSNSAVAYFFCTYRDSDSRNPSAILSAIAVQLARQNESAYGILENYHEELRNGHSLPREPDIEGLHRVLERIFESFDQVYLIVDGLDECGDHVEICVKTLCGLAEGRYTRHKVNMALLSRDEVAIRERLDSEFALVEIEAHTEDLQLYVAAELENRIASRDLRVRDVSLKDHILTELVKGAKGM